MIYMFLEDGFEETEAIATLDMIIRAEIDIKTVGKKPFVTGAHGICIAPDLTCDEITKDGLSGIILPGGLPGTTNLEANPVVQEYAAYCYENGLMLAAICAAPSVFGKAGYLENKKAVCYPSFEEYLKGAKVLDEKSVADGNVITAKAMGASFEFGKNIIEYLKSKEAAERVMNSIYA